MENLSHRGRSVSQDKGLFCVQYWTVFRNSRSFIHICITLNKRNPRKTKGFKIQSTSMFRSVSKDKNIWKSVNIELSNGFWNNQKQSFHSVELVKMKLSFLFLKSVFVEGWDGPWDGINAMTDNVLQSNDNMELNRDPKLTFVGRVDSYHISPTILLWHIWWIC